MKKRGKTGTTENVGCAIWIENLVKTGEGVAC